MKKRLILLVILCIAGLIAFFQPSVNLPLQAEHTVRTHFIDVGQGDATFLELPDSTTILIDAGEQDAGETVVSYIKNLGYDKIDIVVATHPHADHIGGMAKVLRSFEVGRMYMPKKEHTSKTFANMLKVIEEKEIPLYTAKRGVILIEQTDLKAELLSPVSESYEDLNNYSAVLNVTYGKTGLLFTGDAEQEVEEQLLHADISAQILKVGHHGSSTSSSQRFLDKVNPAYAVISCGAKNDYGHPHRETMDALSRMGCTILRTDQKGCVVLDADKSGTVKEVSK